MNDLVVLTEFLGWCTVINFALLSLAAIGLMTMRSLVVPIHARMFRIDAEDIAKYYFQYLAQYKMLVIVFNLVPYVSLKIMA